MDAHNMQLISYAQNFEDVMLWRALKHIKNGFYVDVGAQHPVIDSVSKMFYEQGWRGLHVEPVPNYAQLLREDRPEDSVLQAVLGSQEGVVELNIISDTGLSTVLPDVALTHSKKGFNGYKQIVPQLTLTKALELYKDRDIHWLKIDVEGFELDVLKGWDSEVFRPWIIVVEATKPMSQEPNYETWDPILNSANYNFVYFDGLNRFYIAAEHAELSLSFNSPPNVFDEVSFSSQNSGATWTAVLTAEKRLLKEEKLRAEEMFYKNLEVKTQELNRQIAKSQSLEQTIEDFKNVRALLSQNFAMEIESRVRENVLLTNQVAQLHNILASHQAAILQADVDIQNLHQSIRDMHSSFSWRLTSPMRKITKYVPSGLKKQIRRVLKACWWLVTPWKIPKRLEFIKSRRLNSAVKDTIYQGVNVSDLSPFSTQVYKQLQFAIEKSHENNN